MGVSNENELFRLMEETPIYFETAEDYQWFLSYVKQHHRHTYWWPYADRWDYSAGWCCIGVSPENHQICTMSRLRSKNYLTLEEAKVVLEKGTLSIVDFSDLM